MRHLISQFLRFGVVGAVGVVVNVVVFNVLRATVWAPERVHLGPLYATVAATAAAIGLNWLGNRYWAFREHRRADAAREGAEFLLVSLAGLVIPLACVGVSHYVLGLHAQLADTVANNVVGLALGTAFRFALYRWWVWSPERHTARQPLATAPSTVSSAE
jgi:putative flippase GtrA